MGASPLDTIAAVSTPFGKGGVAIVRLSGAAAAEVADRVFLSRDGRGIRDFPPRHAAYGTLRDPDTGEELDDGLCLLFRAPASFTGEDTVELSCHGGVLVTRSVLEACLRAGARPAEAGEFTRRAFLNGRIGLERVEALGNLLDAGNEGQLRLARAGMNGLVTARANDLYERLLAVLADLEARIDFPEEDLTVLTGPELRDAVGDALDRVAALLRTYRAGRAVAEGVPTVICGRPNVGKSAFYNRLLGRDAAIVTEAPGTTRDVLTETVSLGRVTLRLSDTAGLRDAEDPVERIGVSRARAAAGEAELLFALLDPLDPSPEDEAFLASLPAGKTVIRVYTKRDLPGGRIERPEPADGIPTVSVSSRTGEGFDELERTVEAVFIDRELRVGEEAIVFSARQAAALSAAAKDLSAAADHLDGGIPCDICAEDVRAAAASLGALCGREVAEDALDEIFSKFCIGK